MGAAVRIRGVRTVTALGVSILAMIATSLLPAQTKAPLSPSDIDDIARLLMLEDRRQFDEADLSRLIKSAHPEVRRRAAVSVGRIGDPRGTPLLASARADRDIDVAASVVFATGQLKDPSTVSWLSGLLSSRSTPTPVAREAAIALGKIQIPAARAALAAYLASAPQTTRSAPVAGEALLSIGRFPAGGDIAPIVRWTTSRDADLRWRAAWALFRPRDPAARPHLLRLSTDPAAEVRSWAVRGLAPPPSGRGAGPAPSTEPARQGVSGDDLARSSARLREAVRDPDRRVRTEALRALAQYTDDASFAVVLSAIDSTDSWLSVSAIESIGGFAPRAATVVPRLLPASAPGRPLASRISALGPLTLMAPESAVELAAALVREPGLVPRAAGRQALGRLGAPGKARLDALATEGALPASPNRDARPEPAPARPDADYRRIVERWIVPEYDGRPRPRAVWETPRGTIELELYAGDAPLGAEHFVRVVESGEIVGTEFGRVVPNFVAQQRAIRDDVTLRDEVSRRGLLRATLSWASAGLDTGRPGYTLAITPQPHNEGNFTSLGRVVAGMDAVERLELGDRITAARLLR